LYLVVDQVQVVVAVVMDLAWVEAAAVTLLKCSTLTVVTLPLDLVSLLFVLLPLADVLVVDVVTVEPVVDFMDALLSS
jgi:hypothetical protein